MKSISTLLLLGLLAGPGISQTTDRGTPSADKILKDAEASARDQNKNVLLTISASWCGPCHLLQNFLADPAIRPIFDRYFVKVTMIHGEHPDDSRHQDTPGAGDLLDSLHDTGTSLPLMIMLNSSGKVIADSIHPVYGRRDVRANIGYPSSPVGMAWFMVMLSRAAPSLTSNEEATIQKWLHQHSGNEQLESSSTQ
ncbi:thioredoxin family protein [Acidipila sp. EB88]|uniref:thioredoxin family protein n=1 Tax=Acidipila sp. EB88 TaxID=2305226 RepID=UPI000F5DEC85|nr:thioredoxin family protein [Acidipila sp. EB88]RRA49338.1 thioredoxin family protein [Acidipila sp. EB88]